MTVALALALSAGGAFAAEKLKIGFIYLGPVGDLGWTYQHDLGRLAIVKEFGDKVETTYLENVSEGPDCERSIEQLARAGNKLIFTTSFGYMDADAEGRQEISQREVRACHRLQARRQHVDLFRAVLRRPLHPGHIAAKMSKSGVLGYIALVPDPGSDLRHQRHHARRADDQSRTSRSRSSG